MNERLIVPEPNPREAHRALFVVSAAVLLGSSTWLSGTAVAPALKREWGLDGAGAAWLTSSVQIGFITGTVLYAFFNLGDRFHPRLVFFLSAIAGAGLNAGLGLAADGLMEAGILRFLTGVTLAGIYPVGMKLVATWFRAGLGWGLGVMVGALVCGSSLPYGAAAWGAELPWRQVILISSVLALLGGALVLLGVREGPYATARSPFRPRVMMTVFRHREFRYNAYGYFGHMWELYAFWSVVIFYIGVAPTFDDSPANGPAGLAFLTVASGAVGCALGGWFSRRVGERNVAVISLSLSAVACLGSGFIPLLPAAGLIPVLLAWGFFVVSDSPQFSALAARYCPLEYTATALTIQTGLGFAISVLSIQLVPWMAEEVGWRWALLSLAPGPIAGALAMLRLPRSPS